MSVPPSRVPDNNAHRFSEKERLAFFRLWARRESLPARDRAFLEGLAGVARLTAAAGIRLLALDRGEETAAETVANYRKKRDRGACGDA